MSGYNKYSEKTQDIVFQGLERQNGVNIVYRVFDDCSHRKAILRVESK